MKSLEEIMEFFSHDRYATESGAVIDEVGDKYAKCSIELNEMHRNAVGGVMGAVYYTRPAGCGITGCEHKLFEQLQRKETDCGSNLCKRRKDDLLLPNSDL